MSMLMTTASTNLTMSSMEVAERTGKLHKNVMADIRKMLTELGKAEAEFLAPAQIPGPNRSTRTVLTFNLPKRECLILVSGYSVALRAAIVDRWQELEAQAARPAIPNFLDPEAACEAWLVEYRGRPQQPPAEGTALRVLYVGGARGPGRSSQLQEVRGACLAYQPPYPCGRSQSRRKP